jgi:hypothetical protein
LARHTPQSFRVFGVFRGLNRLPTLAFRIQHSAFKRASGHQFLLLMQQILAFPALPGFVR